jgi:hypothetical protein
MKTILFPILFFSTVTAIAQDKFTFQSQNYLGLLKGERRYSYQLETINGFQKNSWFAGVGVGLDNYRIRSIPLFLDVSKFFFQKQQFFASANAGVNFTWAKEMGIGNRDNIRYPAKLFWEGGLGYRINLDEEGNGLLINAGYSYKQLQEKRTVTTPCLIPPCPETYDVYDFKFKRVFFKVGLLF